MKQNSGGRRPGRHRPRHARASGLTARRAVVCLSLLAGLALALGFAGSRGPAGGGVARAAAPPAQAAAPAETESQHPLGLPGPTTQAWSTSAEPVDVDAQAAGLAPISDAFPASGLAADGIPITALTAYQAAALRESARTPDCGLSWPLLAGIGRVESDHGRFAGAVLHSDGLSTPPVVGIPLNGDGTALILDTDGGALDGDTVYDRAVGPMQFIPSTWAGWGVDANGDGVKDPFNIFDAAAAAADYLCAAGRDLTTTRGQVQAILSYNWSWDYVTLVMSLEQVYASGAVGVTVPVLPANPESHHGRPTGPQELPPVDPGTPVGAGSGTGTGSGSGSHPKPTPTSTSSLPSPIPTSTAPTSTSGSTSTSTQTSPVPTSSAPTSSTPTTPVETDPSCPTESASTGSGPTPEGCATTSASGTESSGSVTGATEEPSAGLPSGGEVSPSA